VGAQRFHLGKYVLRNQIGRGDFGRVFLALHPQLEREVAIKALSRRFTQRPDIVERFLTDARKAAALDHPHVLHVYDIDSDEGQFYIVMEPIAGDDLRHRVEAQGPLPIEAVTRMLAEAAAGLAHAHDRGVLHQTLQPASCMLDAQGSLKIVGFGMGRLAQADRLIPASDVAPTQVVWRAVFTAPEQQPEEAPGDARGDLYSLGCVAYFALTGQVPHGTGSGGGWPDIARQLQELRADIPPGLAELIGRLMAPQPQDRLATAVELGQAVRDLSESLTRERPPVDSRIETGPLNAFDWQPDSDEASLAARREHRLRRNSSSVAAVPLLRTRSPWLGFYIALVLTGLVIGAAVLYWLTRPPAAGKTASAAGAPPRVRDAGSAKPKASKVDTATAGVEDAKSAAGTAQPPEKSDAPAGSNETPPAPPDPAPPDPTSPTPPSPAPGTSPPASPGT